MRVFVKNLNFIFFIAVWVKNRFLSIYKLENFEKEVIKITKIIVFTVTKFIIYFTVIGQFISGISHYELIKNPNFCTSYI